MTDETDIKYIKEYLTELKIEVRNGFSTLHKDMDTVKINQALMQQSVNNLHSRVEDIEDTVSKHEGIINKAMGWLVAAAGVATLAVNVGIEAVGRFLK